MVGRREFELCPEDTRNCHRQQSILYLPGERSPLLRMLCFSFPSFENDFLFLLKDFGDPLMGLLSAKLPVWRRHCALTAYLTLLSSEPICWRVTRWKPGKKISAKDFTESTVSSELITPFPLSATYLRDSLSPTTSFRIPCFVFIDKDDDWPGDGVLDGLGLELLNGLPSNRHLSSMFLDRVNYHDALDVSAYNSFKTISEREVLTGMIAPSTPISRR